MLCNILVLPCLLPAVRVASKVEVVLGVLVTGSELTGPLLRMLAGCEDVRLLAMLERRLLRADDGIGLLDVFLNWAASWV